MIYILKDEKKAKDEVVGRCENQIPGRRDCRGRKWVTERHGGVCHRTLTPHTNETNMKMKMRIQFLISNMSPSVIDNVIQVNLY